MVDEIHPLVNDTIALCMNVGPKTLDTTHKRSRTYQVQLTQAEYPRHPPIIFVFATSFHVRLA